jgi:hypothetical protein
MSKFKAPKPKKSAAAQNIKGGLPCVILIISGFALVMLLFYAVLKSGS